VPVLAGFVDVGIKRAHGRCAMPHQLTKLTPNLVVSDISRSIEFYRDVLGFTLLTTVPDAPPYVFAIVQSGPVEIFLNAPEPAIAEYPAFKGRELGGTFTMFIEVTGIDRMHDELKSRIPIVAPLETKWYGVTEFVTSDPDGYLITFAERR
jgi:catechol 2,3-dioxygenase-like lactoylglutathione lyase family enzyme